MTGIAGNSPLVCPHCSKAGDEQVEDYVVLGVYGRRNYWYTDACGWCDESFGVRRLDDDTYEVAAF